MKKVRTIYIVCLFFTIFVTTACAQRFNSMARVGGTIGGNPVDYEKIIAERKNDVYEFFKEKYGAYFFQFEITHIEPGKGFASLNQKIETSQSIKKYGLRTPFGRLDNLIDDEEIARNYEYQTRSVFIKMTNTEILVTDGTFSGYEKEFIKDGIMLYHNEQYQVLIPPSPTSIWVPESPPVFTNKVVKSEKTKENTNNFFKPSIVYPQNKFPTRHKNLNN